jgi:hypothetical protein
MFQSGIKFKTLHGMWSREMTIFNHLIAYRRLPLFDHNIRLSYNIKETSVPQQSLVSLTPGLIQGTVVLRASPSAPSPTLAELCSVRLRKREAQSLLNLNHPSSQSGFVADPSLRAERNRQEALRRLELSRMRKHQEEASQKSTPLVSSNASIINEVYSLTEQQKTRMEISRLFALERKLLHESAKKR